MDGTFADMLPGRRRSFLFLQGPLSRFFDELGRALIARGHRVHRVNLHLGEQLFWRLPASHFRGRFEDWRGFVGGVLDEHEVTDVILVGDQRPYHIVAAEEARARGIAVIATDFGYLRPGFITFEHDGMTTYSRFPRDPEAIRELAARLPEPEFQEFPTAPFRMLARLDIAFTVPQVLGRPLYPHYRWHGIFHPFAEYVGWAGALARRRLGAGAARAAMARLEREPGSYFLLPLQLATDFQLRAHSPFSDARDIVRRIVSSFVASGSERRLVVVVHPLDNGLINWRRIVRDCADGTAATDRVAVLEGGIPDRLLRHAAGIVTVNSTVGVTALRHGIPVKALGSAVYDVPGLTCQGRLDDFWHDPAPPDPELTAAFVRALAGTTQIGGGFHTPEGKAIAIAGIVRRLEDGLFPLPPLSDADLARRRVRPAARTIVVAGAAGGIGLALARAYAEPGARLCLVGGTAETLATAVGDCVRRGAEVDAIAVESEDAAAIVAEIEAYDRHTPADLVVACAGGGEAADARRPVRWPGARPAAEFHLLAALTASGGLAERMGLRGRGMIAVVAALAGRAELACVPTHVANQAGLLAYYKALRGRAPVSVARAGRLAGLVAACGGDPRLVAVSADRAAQRIRRGLERGTGQIAFPGPLSVGFGALRLAAHRLREWPRRALSAAANRRAEAAEPVPMPGETTLGD